MKSTPGVNFINLVMLLRSALNFTPEKASQKYGAECKMALHLTLVILKHVILKTCLQQVLLLSPSSRERDLCSEVLMDSCPASLTADFVANM